MTRTTSVIMCGVACWLLAGVELGACPVCFRVEASPVTDGVQAAVWVLVTITGAVLGGFGVFARRIARRAAHLDANADAAGPSDPRES